MGKVLDYISFTGGINESETDYYHDSLNSVFWEKKKDRKGDIKWTFDQRVRRKLVKIGKEFYSQYADVLGERVIKDIILTGSLANFNYTKYSDLDVHVLVNLDGIDDENPKILKSAIDGVRFIWNLRHDIKIRNHDVELYLQNENEEHTSSAIFSLLNNEWIKKPIYSEPDVDDQQVDRKYEAIVADIENMHTRLMVSGNMPSNARQLHNRCVKIKAKIFKMRRESLSKGGEMSVGNLVFKKLRNEGYIKQLIDIISKSYDKIYTE